MKLPIFPQDKANHFIYGAAVTSLAALFSVVAAIILCVVVAVGREVYNKIYGGEATLADIGWTLAGGGVVLFPSLRQQISSIF
jgi:ABC-type amino acid transport system permease subunit